MTHLLNCPPPRDRDEMTRAMLRCEQTAGQTVYQHGQSVHGCLLQLLAHLRGEGTLPEGQWRLSTWLDDYRNFFLTNLHHEEVVQQYAVYHDCGKPYCRVHDPATGRTHFPNHAEASAYVWGLVGGDERVGLLIRDDMVLHTASAEEIEAKLGAEWSREDAATLTLVALAEIHSNARMFGGLDSTNFKMKWKTVDKRGRQVCKALAAHG